MVCDIFLKSFGIGAIFRKRQEIQCLLNAGFKGWVILRERTGMDSCAQCLGTGMLVLL